MSKTFSDKDSVKSHLLIDVELVSRAAISKLNIYNEFMNCCLKAAGRACKRLDRGSSRSSQNRARLEET